MKNPFYVPGLTESVEQELKAKKEKEKSDEKYITVTGAVKKTYVTTDRGVQRVKKVEDRQSIRIPIWEKYALTIKEASEYYGISESKLRDFLMLNIKQPFVLKGGARLLVIVSQIYTTIILLFILKKIISNIINLELRF